MLHGQQPGQTSLSIATHLMMAGSHLLENFWHDSDMQELKTGMTAGH